MSIISNFSCLENIYLCKNDYWVKNNLFNCRNSMKRNILVLVATFFGTLSLMGQDIVVNREGTRYDGFVMDERGDSVRLRMKEANGVSRDTSFAKTDIYDMQLGVTEDGKSADVMDNRNAFIVGLGASGTSMAGVEYERMIGSRWSVMAGGGFAGCGAGIGCHFQRTVNSGFVAARYWMNGFGNNDNALGLRYMAVGGSVTLRGTKWWWGEAGAGAIVKKGVAISDWNDKMPICIRLAGGIYFGF